MGSVSERVTPPKLLALRRELVSLECVSWCCPLWVAMVIVIQWIFFEIEKRGRLGIKCTKPRRILSAWKCLGWLFQISNSVVPIPKDLARMCPSFLGRSCGETPQLPFGIGEPWPTADRSSVSLARNQKGCHPETRFSFVFANRACWSK